MPFASALYKMFIQSCTNTIECSILGYLRVFCSVFIMPISWVKYCAVILLFGQPFFFFFFSDSLANWISSHLWLKNIEFIHIWAWKWSHIWEPSDNCVPYLSPGQTESQVDAGWKLGYICESVWPGLACTCVDLQWLALTLVEIKFARKSKQVFHCLAIQPKSTQVEWHSLSYY